MKKVLSLVLAVMLVVGMSSVGFAATDVYKLGLSTDAASIVDSYDKGDTNPDGEFIAYIFKNNQILTKDVAKKDKIDIKIKAAEGSKAYDKVELKYEKTGEAYVKVSFIDPYVATKELDYDYTIYLTVNKKRQDKEHDFNLTGTLKNEDQEVDENDDHVYLADVPVVKALAYIKNIQVEIGQGVSIYTKMFEDKKYYGQCTQEVKAEDDEILNAYPSIDTIYYLNTIGLNSSGNTVEIDIDDKMYVYNADLEYVGTTNDRLPYSTKYYVSTTLLDVDDDDDIDDDDIEGPSDDTNPDMGGDDVPANVNDNPGTGR